jgi:hypothetical protein
VQLVVVLLPQRPSLRAPQWEPYYGALMGQVRSALADTPFLDLRDLLDDSLFVDDHDGSDQVPHVARPRDTVSARTHYANRAARLTEARWSRLARPMLQGDDGR